MGSIPDFPYYPPIFFTIRKCCCEREESDESRSDSRSGCCFGICAIGGVCGAIFVLLFLFFMFLTVIGTFVTLPLVPAQYVILMTAKWKTNSDMPLRCPSNFNLSIFF